MGRRRRYSAEFKREALRRASEEGITLTDLLAALALHTDRVVVGRH